MKRRLGFTLVELLTVVIIIIILVSIAMPALSRAVELGRRTKCKGNLRAIFSAMEQYATEDPDNTVFPADSHTIAGTSYIGANYTQRPYWENETDHSGSVSGQAGTSRCMFMTVRKGASLKQFICPSVDGHEVNDEVDPTDEYDFRTEKEVSYSYNVQKTLNGGVLTFRSDPASKVMLADRTPISGTQTWGGSGTGRSPSVDADSGDAVDGGFDEWNHNSFNHLWNRNQEGQNVLRLDGSQRWETTPFCGAEDEWTNKPDNIWCPWNYQEENGIRKKTGDKSSMDSTDLNNRGPQHELDSFLWP